MSHSPTTETELPQRFVDASSDVPEPQEADLKGPGLVPFESALKLTVEQEQRMLDHAFRRKEEIENELGRNLCTGNSWFSSTGLEAEAKDKARRSFFGKRELFELSYNNDVTWREYLLGPEEDNIFCTSNLTAPISRRITRQMVARANNYFFGTDPWLAAYPVGSNDVELADKADRFAKFKLGQCDAKHVFELAVELAFVRGEAVIKTTYEKREDIYQHEASVLVDGSGNPVIARDGDYIFEEDLWIEQTEIAIDPSTHQQGPPLPTGRMVLKRDGVTPKPEVETYEFRLVPRRITKYKGPRADVVYFKDFLCPLNASSVQDADCIIHITEQPVSEIVDSFMRWSVDNQADGEPGADGAQSSEKQRPDIERLVSVVRELASESGEPKSEKNKMERSPDSTNYRPGTSGIGATFERVDFHFKFDANGDGIEEQIWLVADARTKRPIFYNYQANESPDGLRPYDVIRVNEVDGRWYGVGSMEMFETYQEAIDLLLNRWNISQSAAGRVTAFNPDACYEGDTDPDLKLNDTSNFTLKKGRTIDDLVQTKLLMDAKFDQLKEQMEFFLQMAMNESGVQHANDAEMVGLDQSKLATGIRNIEKSGQEMFSLYLSHLEPGFRSCLKKFLKLLFAKMDDVETFEYFEGKVGTELTMTREEVGDLEMNVDLEMTRYRGEQQLTSNLQAAQHVAAFYQFPPEIQLRVAPFYIQILKALQIQDADTIISPLPIATVPVNGTTPPGAPAQSPLPGPSKAPPLL